jgi:L-lysine exporter family protein LysE/ArgO
MWHLFIIGFFMGLGAAAVPGPINLEVVRRTLSRGPRQGFAFGMGAVTADVIFVIAGTLGALALINALPEDYRAALFLLGSILLLFIGVSALRARVPVDKKPIQVTQAMPSLGGESSNGVILSTVRSYFLALVLTLASPSTIMWWLFTIVGVSKITGEAERQDLVPGLLASGVGTACTLWVAAMVTVTGRFHRKIQPQTYLLVERICGGALCVFGFYSLYEAIKLLL